MSESSALVVSVTNPREGEPGTHPPLRFHQSLARMSASDINDRLRRGWRKAMKKSSAIINSGNAFFSQITHKIVDKTMELNDKVGRLSLWKTPCMMLTSNSLDAG